MKVKLLHNSPLWLASHSIRMSHDNHDNSDTLHDDEYGTLQSGRLTSCEAGDKDKAIIARVGNKLKHKSVLEQLVYWYDIDGISRACLQELARHRTARLTVKSSRYTLNELRTYKYFSRQNREDYANMKDAEKFVVYTGDAYVDDAIFDALMNLQDNICRGNDIAKYCLPEAFKTRLQWQIDGRNLQNFLSLRTSKDALWEIQQLARAIYEALPSEHKYLYREYIMDSTNPAVVGGNTETTI